MYFLNFPNPVKDEADFFGRLEELMKIEQGLFTSRVPFIIVGERRIGKTSLLNIVITRLVQRQLAPFVTLPIEPRGLTTFNQFCVAILPTL